MKRFKIKETAAIAALTASMMFSGCSSTNKETKALKEYLADSNYKEASKYYSQNSEKIKYTSITKDLGAAIEEVYEDYIDENASKEDTVNNLNFLASMCEDDLEEDIQDKLEEIEKIDTARQNYKKAESLYEKGSYVEAIEYYGRLKKGDENYSDAVKKIEECEEKYSSKVLEDAAGFASAGDYESAITTLKDAQNKIKKSMDFDTKIKEYENALLTSSLQEAEAAASSGDYESAIRILKDAQKVLENAPEIEAKIVEYEDAKIEAALATAYAEISNGQYYEAIQEISKVESMYPGNEKIKKLREDTEASYLSQVLQQMDAYIAQGDIQNALAIANKALTVLPDAPEINARLAQIESMKPVSLSDMTISESKYFDQLKDPEKIYKDTIGNSYSTENLFKIHKYNDGWGRDEAGYAKIYVNSQFKNLQGTVAVDESSNTSKVKLMIYADDNLVYSDDFDRATAPKSIDVDLTGRQWIEIRIAYADNKDTGSTVELLLSNFSFYKQ